MNKPTGKQYALFIGLSETVGLLSGLISREGTALYGQMAQKPTLAPPGWVFPVVWTVLYALMGIGGARVWSGLKTQARSRGLNLFIAQLIINFFWSPIILHTRQF